MRPTQGQRESNDFAVHIISCDQCGKWLLLCFICKVKSHQACMSESGPFRALLPSSSDAPANQRGWYRHFSIQHVRLQRPACRAIQQLKRGRPSSNCNPTPVAAPTEQTWASSTSCRTPAVVGSHPVTRFSRHVLVRKMQHDLQEMFRNSCSNNTCNGNQCIV